MKSALNPLDRALLSRQVCLGLCPLSRTNIGRPDCADLALDATLVTANVDHMLRVPGLRVEEFSCRESLPIQGDLGCITATRKLAASLRRLFVRPSTRACARRIRWTHGHDQHTQSLDADAERLCRRRKEAASTATHSIVA